MNELLPYILKSTLCLSLLYLAFRTVMRKETFFALNRSVLLAIVAFSILIPLINLPQILQPVMQEKLMPTFPVIESQLPEFPAVADPPTISGSDNIHADKPERAFPIMQLIGYLYFVGVAFSLLVLIHGIITLLLLFRKAEIKTMEGYKLFILEKDIPAFSFWKMIFISRADYIEHGKTILAHEQQHIRLGHFYDLLLMETTKMIHWFNPIIYWLIQDLKAIHEYQADQHTLTKGIDATKYQLLIIEKGVGPQRLALANSFNHCQIKKRITMMNQSKTGKAWRWKVAIFLPLLALLLMAFGRMGEKEPLVTHPQKAIPTQKSTQVKDTTGKADETVHLVVEQMPQFPGGDMGIREYIAKNMRYPENAKTKRIQGKVFVSYIINAQGKVTNPKIVRGVDPELDAEALRVISQMPSWSPGKEKGKPVSVSYTSPINFVVSQASSNVTSNEITITTSSSSMEPTSIIGTWRLVSYNYGGGDELNPVSPGSERIKFITEKNFNWVHYAGNDKIVTSSAGGSYTFSDNDYTEKIEFGGQGMAGYIGKEHKFTVIINNNKMELAGELADGLRIKELWERVDSK